MQDKEYEFCEKGLKRIRRSIGKNKIYRTLDSFEAASFETTRSDNFSEALFFCESLDIEFTLCKILAAA